MTQLKKLYKSETDLVLAGIAGGIGDYLHLDPIIIRVAFVILTLTGGFGAILYLILWLFLPKKSQLNQKDQDYLKANLDDIKIKSKLIGKKNKIVPIIFIVIGLLILLGNFGPLIRLFLALSLIIFGLYTLLDD